MSELPVSSKVFFSDFSFDLLQYTVNRSGLTYNGLIDEQYHYISFHVTDDIIKGDILVSSNGTYTISKIVYDTYNGVPDLLRAFF
ncbi:hypothetical protein SAMN02746066_03249 [Anaerosporobacter mobilis DSM 15930]|jgi:hypothetical protein|uniref:Uncharacterized protein n=1 Tax=Anaerosporobacter mobilis DSM 15930 TaxID=1120996 RepID=A0A1M7LGH6_9FIRM|nr:hypothetical protein [Anaerosporobacter mobilis]SHM77113.1 hypothetical protein SAMN02746066_03249 [Anaerosporobacter mobilis DSM 15930]